MNVVRHDFQRLNTVAVSAADVSKYFLESVSGFIAEH